MNSTTAYKQFFAIMLVALISVSGIALPYPILAPLFSSGVQQGITDFYNLPAELLFALALAIYPLGILIGSSFIGALSDLYGRKWVLLVTLLLAAVGYCFTAWAVSVGSYALFILARFLTGVCEGNVSICRAIALDLHPYIDKTKAMSLMNATFYAGYLLGPLAGGYLMQFGADAAFWLAALASLLAWVIVLFLLQAESIGTSAYSIKLLGQRIISHNSFGLLKHEPIKPVFWAYLLLAMGINSLYEYFPLWLVSAFQSDSMNIATATAVLTLFMVLASSMLVVKWKAWLGVKKGVLVSMLALAIGLFSLQLFSFNTLLVIGFPFIGCCIALVNGLIPVYISDKYTDFGQGRLMGLLTATFCLANVVMALLGGFIALLSPVYSIHLGGVFILIAVYKIKKIFNQI